MFIENAIIMYWDENNKNNNNHKNVYIKNLYKPKLAKLKLCGIKRSHEVTKKPPRDVSGHKKKKKSSGTQ